MENVKQVKTFQNVMKFKLTLKMQNKVLTNFRKIQKNLRNFKENFKKFKLLLFMYKKVTVSPRES